jgi:predicted ATPase
MIVRKIAVSNFKSFKNLDIELGNLSVFIGANASGKSNFIEIFRFIRDIANHGLDNAVSMQGGIEYLRNTRIGADSDMSLKIISDQAARFVFGKSRDGFVGIETREIIYEFDIGFKRRRSFNIHKDRVTLKCEFFMLKDHDNTDKNRQPATPLGDGEVIISNVDGKVNAEFSLPDEIPSLEYSGPFFLSEMKAIELDPSTLLIETPFFFPIPPFERFFDNLSIYDFDPKLPKKAVPITGKTELEEDGTNLAIVLKDIIGNSNRKRQFANLIKDLLPFIDDLKTEKFVDKSLLFKIREVYTPDLYLPASLLSDGTINITALIIALYFEKKKLTIIEEPERNIHPYLISKVITMMKEASKNKQIIVTTHNPEVVKYTDLENLLFVSRDSQGFSIVSKPVNQDDVRIFLQNDIGIEELYIQDLLKG